MKSQDPKPAVSRVTNTAEQEVAINQSALDGQGYDVPELSSPPSKKSGFLEKDQTGSPDLPAKTDPPNKTELP